MELKGFYDSLMNYYRLHGRKLPWRKSKNPYDIWVSEIILQQTRVAQGTEYFMTFLRYFPNILLLSKATDEEILKIWQGLGYYSRALNMLHTAREICVKNNGIFPNKYSEIKKLKGIGDYTAAAIASIAFDLPHAAVDGNVKRVTARLFGIDEDIHKATTVGKIQEMLDKAIQHYSPGEFNQAMMELGAMVCTPTSPKCDICPMQDKCFAFSNGQQQLLPVKSPKKKATIVRLAFLYFSHQGQTILVKRDKSSIWKGLYEFPNVAVEPNVTIDWILNEMGFKMDEFAVLDHKQLVHKLTHRTIFADFWHLSGMPYNIVSENTALLKVKESDLGSYPIHRLMDKYLEGRMDIKVKK